MMKDSKFIQLIKKQDFSDNIRFYFIYKNKHYFINNGSLASGFSSKLTITKNRNNILSAFSKMGFIFDELIRMRVIGYSDEKNSDELLYVLNLIPLNRKIRAFLDWKVFSPEYTRDMSKLFEVRNALNHAVSVKDVKYSPNKEVLLYSQKGFNRLKIDFEKSWKKLLDIYSKEQKSNYSQLELSLIQ